MGPLLPEVPEELLLEIYRDMAKPGVQQVGLAIGGILSILNLTTIPIRLLSEKGSIWLERNLEKYREKMASIDAADVIEVSPQIAAPILQKMTFTTCDELADMFTNLLKTASTNSGSQYAHPNFVNIIGSISRDEAIILEDKQKGKVFPSLRVKQTFNKGIYTTPVVIFTEYYNDSRLDFPNLDQFYFTNLVKIGLFYDNGGELTSANYNKLHREIEPLINQWRTPKTTNFSIQNEHIGLTEIGKLFLKSVFE